MEPMASERLSSGVQRLLSLFNETGRPFHVDGITVIRQARTVESARDGANLLIMLNPGGIAAGREGAAT
jgi:hypothetical protein